MGRWQIMRNWSFTDAKGDSKQLTTTQLSEFRGCALLGAAGLGKTSEMTLLCDHEQKLGFQVQFKRLAAIADNLRNALNSMLLGATERTTIYLDAFDEAMIPLSTITLPLSEWIKQDLKASGARIRISSRSAVWPNALDEALTEVYPNTLMKASLEPLTNDDIKMAAASHGINGKDFELFNDAVARIGASILTQQPLTLEMMLRMFGDDNQLAPNRKTLFQKGVVEYTREREERREAGTASSFSEKTILEAAERLACFVLLSGRDTIDLGDTPPVKALGLTELTELPGNPPLDQKLIEAVGNSGLCESAGGKSFQFAHRQFAEYLAGRRIASLLPHQARSILSSGVDSIMSIAGPLRETASFAAMYSDALAKWISDCDPDVIGISDVADDSLRRQAMLGYLDRFRSRLLTAQYFELKKAQLGGFRNSHAEEDLGQVLYERGTNADNLLQCAVGFCEYWRFSSLSETLADLFLDTSAPEQARKAAGYALAEFGTKEARLKLKPLFSAAGSLDFDVKGLALRCNWPDNMSVPELLGALTPLREGLTYGAYEAFLFELDYRGFHAAGHHLEGLAWVETYAARRSDYDLLNCIGKRIAHAAVDELDNAPIAAALVKLLYTAWKAHANSPLAEIVKHGIGAEASIESAAPLLGKSNARHILLDGLVRIAPTDSFLWQIILDTPGLRSLDDFGWLLSRTTDTTLDDSYRIQYANFAAALPWYDDIPTTEQWLAAYDQIPRESALYMPLSVDLSSEQAKAASQMAIDMKRLSRARHTRPVRPNPAARVQDVLSYCETKDPKGFFGLCQELTLKEDSTHYEFERFLYRSPGWVKADEDTRLRVVRSAKNFLNAETDEPERIRSEPISSIFSGYMHAIWLVLEIEGTWIEALPTDWWSRWMLYLLRQLSLNMHGEPQEPKMALLRIMHQKAPAEFRRVIVELTALSGEDSRHLLSSLLNGVDAISDSHLDEQLANRLSKYEVSTDRIGLVAEFVLGRDLERALPVCVGLLDQNVITANEDIAIKSAVALLFEATSQSWENVLSFINARRDLAPRILADFAHNERQRFHHGVIPQGLGRLSTSQLGQLISLLVEFFPMEDDPKHEGAHFVTPNDSARTLRSQLISALAGTKDAASVQAWRQISARFGTKYSWLHDIQLQVERDYRLSLWSSIPPASIASILDSKKKRLVRSDLDALEGVIAAIDAYSKRLQGEGHHDLEALWNTGAIPPSPKAEEHISDMICDRIKAYFQEYAVTGGREMQIFRRKLPRELKGEPGSLVDVIIQIPATGSAADAPIVVPIEVKLSRNPEARTGLQDQLVDRYIRQAGTSVGAFVVAWMQAPKLADKDKPVWTDIVAARKELEEQARTVNSNSKSVLTVGTYVIDATLKAKAD